MHSGHVGSVGLFGLSLAVESGALRGTGRHLQMVCTESLEGGPADRLGLNVSVFFWFSFLPSSA